MEDYYNTLLKHLDGYTVMGLFDGKRDVNDIVTLQTGNKGRVFFFDQEPMIKGIDDALWNYIFQEPTIFANSELDSIDKDYVKSRYPNFIDWYYFSHALIAREWFSTYRYCCAGKSNNKSTVLDCNLITGSRQYRVFLIYNMFIHNLVKNSYFSFNGEHDWKQDLKNYDEFDLLNSPEKYFSRIPTKKISYDNWGESNNLFNGFMQSRIPLDYYSQVNYISVSETLFIENKKHLSEKVFKPIVAGKPFLLFAGYQNLKYLKQYGFKTFEELWPEDYDNIPDPRSRLLRIIDIMLDLELDKFSLFEEGSDEYIQAFKGIENKMQTFESAEEIADQNRKYFWSNNFYNKIINEAVNNLETAKLELASKRV